jgi:pyruvate kinase
MLSGETANGMFPIESVETMAKINTESEMLFNYQPLHKQFLFYRQPFNKLSFPTYAKKIAIKIYQETMPRGKNRDISFPIEFVVIFTNDEKIIKAISNIRPGANIIVITDDENIYTAYGIYYAILTYKVDDLEDAKKNNIEVAKNALKIYSGDLSKSRIFIKNNFIPFKK